MRKQKKQSSHKGINPKPQFLNLHTPSFLRLIAFLMHSTRDVQNILIPYIIHLGGAFVDTDFNFNPILNQLKRRRSPSNIVVNEKWQNSFDKLAQIFGLEALLKQEKGRKRLPSLLEFYTSTKDPTGRGITDAINSLHAPEMVHPQYYIKQLIAKIEGQHDIGTRLDHQNIQTEKQSKIYFEPRFSEKLTQLMHFQKNGEHRGEIALLEYTGNFIVGNRVWAIAKGNYFQIWQRISTEFPNPFAQSSHQSLVTGDNQNEEEADPDKYMNPANFNLKRHFRFVGHHSKVICASFSHDQLYVITGSADKTVKLWCLRLNVLLCTFKFHTKTVWDVHFNPSGLYFLSGGADGMMILWKTDNPKPQRVFYHTRDIYKVQFAKNPDFAICAGQEGILNIYHIVTSDRIFNVLFDNPIVNFDLGHSGIFIVVVQSDGRVTIHNMQSGATVASFYFYFTQKTDIASQRQPIHSICLSENEKDLVCISSQHILFYSMNTLSQSVSVTKEGRKEKKVTPYFVLMSMSDLRFNFCKFSHKNLLVVAGSKFVP